MEINTETVQIMSDPPTVTLVHDDDGPILLIAQWQIDIERRDEFVAAMEPVRRALKQKGALRWHLVEHVEQPGRMLESFTMSTWSEYKRLSERATMADKDLLYALHDAAGSDLPPLQAHRVINVSPRRKGHSGMGSE